MKYVDYREHRQQGTFDFPIEFYHRYQMPYHWHLEYEIIRILEGSFHLTLDNKTIDVNKGDILFLQDGTLHGGIPENCIYECLVFDMNLLVKEGNVCAKQIQKMLRHEIVIRQQLPTNLICLQNTIDSLFQAMAVKRTGYEFLTQGYLYQLLGILLGEHLYEVNTTSANISQQHVLIFKSVLSYIEDHYTGHIALEDLSRIAGMNSKYFCRFFREMSYRTPIDYLNYYRIECACEQLSATKNTIIEVALDCGFNDISYFIKTFRKYKGISPKQYRKAEDGVYGLEIILSDGSSQIDG